MWAFSHCSEQALLLVLVGGLLFAAASLLAEHGLLSTQAVVITASEVSSCGSQGLGHRFNSRGARA